MRAGLSIGDFSQITHLSVKTLRRYHEAALLQPAEVDPHTGYRYYATTQVPTAQVIRRFRELGMPVREVREVLATTDPQARSALIAVHLERLENQLDETRAAVTSLRRLLQPASPPIQVEIRAAEAVTAAAIGAAVDHREVVDWYGAAMAELDQTLRTAHLTPAGPCGGLYDNELFTDDRGNAVVYVPVADPPAAGRVRPFHRAGRRTRDHRASRPARRHRRVLRPARHLRRRARPGRRRAGARNLPHRTAGHRRQRRLAHRDRLASLPRLRHLTTPAYHRNPRPTKINRGEVGRI